MFSDICVVFSSVCVRFVLQASSYCDFRLCIVFHIIVLWFTYLHCVLLIYVVFYTSVLCFVLMGHRTRLGTRTALPCSYRMVHVLFHLYEQLRHGIDVIIPVYINICHGLQKTWLELDAKTAIFMPYDTDF